MGRIIESNKFKSKSIKDFLDYFEKLPNNLVFIDTETTGLGGAKIQQLTQISAIVCDKNFKEISHFDEKIELIDDIKDRMEKDVEFPKGIKTPENYFKDPWPTKKVLKFNHYFSGDYNYGDEKQTIEEFSKWMEDYKPCTLVIQNASFDLSMINGRYGNIIGKYPVLDTKIIIQLFYLPLIQSLRDLGHKQYNKIIEDIGASHRDNGLLSSSLSKIGPSLGVKMEGYHDSLTDCRITISVIEKIVNLLNKYHYININKYQIERILSNR